MAAHGFKPLRHLTGGQIRTSDYLIAIAYDTSIFTGDPVKLVAGGGIELAAAGNTILGIFQGVSWTASDGEVKFSRYWPGAQSGATNVSALVIDDPYVTYSVFDDGDSDFLTIADVGFSADHVAGSGSTVTGISAVKLDTSSASATAAGFKPGPYAPQSYDAAALIVLAMQAGNSADRASIAKNVMDVANAPGTKIYPGELKKGLDLLAEGKKINYEGATGVAFTDVGEAEGSFLEKEISGGKFETKKQR